MADSRLSDLALATSITTADLLYLVQTGASKQATFATLVTLLQGSFVPYLSPGFTGTPYAPTAAAGTNTVQLATCAFVLANAAPRSFEFRDVGAITTGQKAPAKYVDAACTAYSLNATISAGTVTARIEKSTDGGTNWTTVGSVSIASGLSATASLSVALAATTLLRVNYTAASGCSDPVVTLLSRPG